MRPLFGPVLTAAEMKAAEVGCGVPLDVLMERAGAALADAVARFGNGQPVLVLCGPGNNGGDGYVAARLLAGRGYEVRVAATAPSRTDLSIAAAARWHGLTERLDSARAAPVLVDALFGTGLARPLDQSVADPLERLSSEARIRIAADLPSGVSTDDGADLGSAGADITIAFGAAKPAHLLQPAASRCGRVLVADIGIDVQGASNVLAAPSLTPPSASTHKYTRGMVAIVAGAMPGAATLGASAAAHVAGYTVLCGKGDAPAAVVRRGFAATLADKRLGAMLIGPGLSDTLENRETMALALASDVPLVLDAGALAMVEPSSLCRAAPTIVTPHDGEFARLFGSGNGSKLVRARDAAVQSGAAVVFKGSDTVIASPDGRLTLAPPASSWLATAGTGDVLAGLVAGLLSQGCDPHEAACAAVWLHGEAARRAGAAFIADDLLAHIPGAVSAAL